MSRILSRISMLTGQISSHALQLVHAQISSGGDALEHAVGGDVDVGVHADRRGHRRRAGRGHDLADLQHDLAGSSGLPVACAGHTDVQRPQTVQASVSNSCFQVKSSIVDRAEGLEIGLHQVRHRLHRALGPVAVAQVHVHRRREHVAQLGRRAGSQGSRGTRPRGCPRANGARRAASSATSSSRGPTAGSR